MKGGAKTCIGVLVMIAIISIVVSECKRGKTAPLPKIPPGYNGNMYTHDVLDSRALPLLSKNESLVVIKSGDTTITWAKQKGKWRKIYYLERKSIKDSAYSTLKIYDEDLWLYQECEMFQQGMYTGLLKEYDKKGMLVAVTDKDHPFTFTINDLIEKIKIEYNVDLTKQLTGEQWADRTSGNSGLAKYRVRINSPKGKYFMEIHGRTGSLIRGPRRIYE